MYSELSYISGSSKMSDEESSLLSTTQLAKKLGLHRITVVRMANDGRIPYIKISDTEYRYDYGKVIEALENNTNK